MEASGREQISQELQSLDFIPQPENRETFKGFEEVSDSCPFNQQSIH